MATLKLGSLAGSVSVTVNAGNATDSETDTFTLPPLADGDNTYFAQDGLKNPLFTGNAMNYDSIGKLDRCFLGNGPIDRIFNRTALLAQAGSSGNTFVIGSGFNTNFYSSPALVGAKARVVRVVNGVLEERVSDIVAANIDLWPTQRYIYPYDTGEVEANQANATSTIRIAFGSTWRKNAVYYIGIAGVTQAGLVGPVGYLATTTITNIPTGTAASVSYSIVSLTGNLSFAGGSGLAAPTGVALTEVSAGVWEITCSAVSGAFGYRAFVSDADPATMPANQLRTVTLANDGGFSIEPGVCQMFMTRIIERPSGDMLHFRIANGGASRGQLLARDWWARDGVIDATINGAIPYEWKRFGSGDAAPETGLEWYMKRGFAAGLVGTSDNCGWVGGAEDTFYEQGSTTQVYNCEFWYKATAAYSFGYVPFSGNAFTLDPGGTPSTVSRVPLSATTTWQKATFSFKANSVSNSIKAMYFDRPDTDEVDLMIAGFSIARDGEVPLDLDTDAKTRLGSNALMRFHMTVNNTGSNIDLQTSKTGMSGIPTIAGSLRIAKELGAIPYLQTQFYWTADEMLNLAAYLAAPVSSGHPYAQRRADQGQTAPWVDEFSAIKKENGNEPWNIASGYIGPVAMLDQATGAAVSSGTIYGLYTKRQVDALQSSPYWPALAPVLQISVAGWINGTFGRDACLAIGPSRVTDVLFATYIGGDFASFAARDANGEGYYTMTSGAQTNQLLSYANRAVELSAIGVASGVYEGSIGYAQSGQNSAANVIANEVLGKSRAAISGSTDSVMGVISLGGQMFTYFSDGPGDRWNSNALPSEGNQIYGMWRILQQLNEELGQCSMQNMRAVKETIISVTTNQTTTTLPAFGIYRLNSITYPGRVCLVICPRDIDRSLLDPADALYNASYNSEYDLDIITGLTSATSVRKLSYCGDFREHNRYPVGFRKDPVTNLYTVSDALCVDIEPDWETITPPSVARIDVNADIEPVLGGPLVISFRGAT
jgi:hypothetical protein